MKTEQQSAVLRALRAWLDADQKPTAAAAGVAERTLLDAEKGRTCSDRTWDAMLTYYASRGLHWRGGGEGPAAMLIE